MGGREEGGRGGMGGERKEEVIPVCIAKEECKHSREREKGKEGGRGRGTGKGRRKGMEKGKREH